MGKNDTVLVLSKLKPQRNVLKYLRYLITLHIVWSLVRHRDTRLQTMYNILKFSEKWWNNVNKSIYKNRNATATQPQRNRKFCQINNDQYCTYSCSKTSENRTTKHTLYSVDFKTGSFLIKNEGIAGNSYRSFLQYDCSAFYSHLTYIINMIYM